MIDEHIENAPVYVLFPVLHIDNKFLYDYECNQSPFEDIYCEIIENEPNDSYITHVSTASGNVGKFLRYIREKYGIVAVRSDDLSYGNYVTSKHKMLIEANKFRREIINKKIW